MKTRVGVIGGGIAGASAAYYLTKENKELEVILIEAENQLGIHTTGRSAALLLENDGTASTRSIVKASVNFLRNPPVELTQNAFVRPRPVMHLATREQSKSMDRLIRENYSGSIPTREISTKEAKIRFPPLNEEKIDRVAIDEGSGDIDVHELHQSYLKGFRQNGGQIKASSRVDSVTKKRNSWKLETTDGNVSVDLIVNASGAWGDVVAERANIKPVGLEPRRRTAFTVNKSEIDPRDWAMITDIDLRFYVKPDGMQLLCSLGEENPSEPCDAKPEEIDVALAIKRINSATTLEIHNVHTAWTGLRTFVTDRSMVIGPDPDVDNFFWCVGQGGTGIMTSPGAGKLLSDFVNFGHPSSHFDQTGLDADDISPFRFRKK